MKHSTTPRLTSLPVIDLASPDAAQQLYRAGSEVGFQCLVNHGVDAEADGTHALLPHSTADPGSGEATDGVLVVGS